MKIKLLIASFVLCGIANAQWQPSSTGNTSGVTHCFIETSGILLSGSNEAGIYSSTNNGTTWTISNTGIVAGSEILCLGKNSAGIFAGSDSLIYFSSNNGASWSIVNSSGNAVFAFAFLTDTVYAATMGGGVIMSINNGSSWTTANTGITTYSVFSIVKKGNLLFAGTNGSGAFVSSNSGVSWSFLNTAPSTVRCLETDGINIYAGTLGSGMFISSNNGASWTQVTTGLSTTSYVFGITSIGNVLLAGASMNGVYRSLDNGASWSSFNTGLPSFGSFGAGYFYETSLYIFCGIEGGSLGTIFRIDKNQVLAGIETVDENIFFSIYPNPFSSSTTLQTGNLLHNATLTVYNCFGQKVNEIKNLSGDSFILHRDNLPSGLYFVRLGENDKIYAGKIVISDK